MTSSLRLDKGLEADWAGVNTRLRTELGDAAYRHWLQPLELLGCKGDQVVLSMPTGFMRDWVRRHYADRLRSLWHATNKDIRSVEIVLRPANNRQANGRDGNGGMLITEALGRPPRSAAQTPLPADGQEPAFARPVAVPSPGGDAAPESAGPLSDIDVQLDARFTFENFVVGKPNELAHAAARRVAESTEVHFNPLFLYGGVGLGKTHLMHAIAAEIRARHPQRRVLYLSAEKFMYRFIRALRFKDMVAFKDQFRAVDVLMIDDVQFIGHKDSTQEEFFHTFNALVDQNRQVILSADKSPSDLQGMEERLRSRLGWGLVADIHPTTYELRLGILQAKTEAMRITVPPKILEFLARRITANVRELEGALTRIVAHATLVGRPLTLDMVQETLRDLLRANDRRVTVEEIQKKVAQHYNIRVNDMHSERRSRNVARPRQIAMYLAKQLTQRSLPEIGRLFGGRDHTTVLHAVKKVEELRASDDGFAEDVDLLRRALES